MVSIVNWSLAGAVVSIPILGLWRQLDLKHAVFEAGRDSVKMFIRLLPFLIMMLIAVGMLRASGAFELITHWLGGTLARIGVPADLLPLAIMRPFSGSATNAVFADIIQTHGGDAGISHVAATFLGGSETTFYVIAIYFGAVGIRRMRYAIPAGLLADLAGFAAAIVIGHWLGWIA